VVIFFVLSSIFRQKKVNTSFSVKLLRIKVPKFSSVSDGDTNREVRLQDIQEKIAIAENLYSTLGGMKAQTGMKSFLAQRDDHFSLEIVLRGGLIYFYIGVLESKINYFKERMHAVYPDAEIEPVDDYNIFTPHGSSIAAYMKLKEHYIFPIKTYKKMEMDPMDSLINSLTKVSKEDSVVIQIVARSANKEWHKKSQSFTRKVSDGASIKDAKRSSTMDGFWGVADKIYGEISYSLTPKKKEEEKPDLDPKKSQLSEMEREMVKYVEEKNSKAGLDVNIRIVVNATNQGLALTYLDNIVNSFSQYNLYQYGNSFVVSKSNQQGILNDFIYRNFNEKFRMVLNTEELAGIYHLPSSWNETPNIVWLEAKKLGAPTNLPTEGLVLGKNVYRDESRIVKMKQKDRSRHVYIIGKSGTGKSYLQVNMAIQDIKNGEGVCVLDPHGDLIEDILEYVPKERVEDVILFDPSDTERPLGINMLEFETQDQKTFVINEMIKIFDKLYDLKATGGPMFEQYMRNAILLIMEDIESGSTLLEIPRVLADEDFRHYKLSKCKDYLVSDFWKKQAEKAGGEASLANMVPYITSKLTPFISNDIMRPIISQQKSAFSFRKVMDEQKILLLNLSKGKIGELNSSLIGMVFVGKILMSALSRVDQAEDERKNFYLYIDEFQNFITDSIAIILSEARKYRLNLTMAHQYVTQLIDKGDETIKDAVFGNAGTFISFRIGVKDAEIVAKQYAPVVSEYDLINLPAFNAYIKLLIDNYNPPAFSLETLQREKPEQNYVKEIKELSRLKYGRDRSIVENEIRERVMKTNKIKDSVI
jgi:hypothetical protein